MLNGNEPSPARWCCELILCSGVCVSDANFGFLPSCSFLPLLMQARCFQMLSGALLVASMLKLLIWMRLVRIVFSNDRLQLHSRCFNFLLRANLPTTRMRAPLSSACARARAAAPSGGRKRSARILRPQERIGASFVQSAHQSRAVIE